VIFEPEFELKL